MQLHLENHHNKPNSKLSLEFPLFVHEYQLLEKREVSVLQELTLQGKAPSLRPEMIVKLIFTMLE